MTPKLSQGVTTVVTGNCGVSLAPLGNRTAVPPLNLVAADAAELPSQRFGSFRDYFAALEAQPPAINCAALVGHTTLRVMAMSALDRPASPSEIAAMQAGVAEALAGGRDRRVDGHLLRARERRHRRRDPRRCSSRCAAPTR